TLSVRVSVRSHAAATTAIARNATIVFARFVMVVSRPRAWRLGDAVLFRRSLYRRFDWRRIDAWFALDVFAMRIIGRHDGLLRRLRRPGNRVRWLRLLGLHLTLLRGFLDCGLVHRLSGDHRQFSKHAIPSSDRVARRARRGNAVRDYLTSN